MSDTEELYGQAGTERSLGYSPMPERDGSLGPEAPPDIERDTAIADRAEEHAQQQLLTVERFYEHVGGENAGERQPDNKTVELDRAAKDLTEIREAERLLAELAANERAAQEIDAARGMPQPSETQPEPQQPEPVQAEPP